MAYTVTYKFGAALNIGDVVAGGHALRLSIAFTIDDTGSNVEKFASTYGLIVSDWGELNIGREIDENLLAIGEYTFELFDKDGEFDNFFFESAAVHLMDKQALVTLEILYYGEENYTTEFTGYIFEDQVFFDTTSKIVQITAGPKTNLLKETFLYLKDSNGKITYQNPLAISSSVSNGKRIWPAIFLPSLFDLIWNVVNPNSTFTNYSTAYFYAENFAATPTALSTVPLNASTVAITGERLGAIFGSDNNVLQIETLYDLLMKLCFGFGLITGMETNTKAFAKDLYGYDASNLQTIGVVKSIKKSFKTISVSAVKIIERQIYRRAKEDNENSFPIVSNRYGKSPMNADVYNGENILEEELLFYTGKANTAFDGVNNINRSDLIYYNVANTSWYDLKGITFPSTQLWPGSYSGTGMCAKIASYYYTLRNNKTLARLDEITFNGIKCAYTKNFDYGGKGYQILTLTKQFAKNTVTVAAIPVIEFEDETPKDDGVIAPPSLSKILPGGYYNNYTFNAAITDVEANLGTYSIINLYPNQRLAELKILIPQTANVTGFESVTAISIEDNDGVIWSGNATTGIKWKAETDETLDAEGIRNIKFYEKTYSAQQTLQIKFTGTAAVGALMNVEVKILARN
jgi:hypothetical protein